MQTYSLQFLYLQHKKSINKEIMFVIKFQVAIPSFYLRILNHVHNIQYGYK